MTLAAVILTIVKVSIALTVLALGMSARASDALYVLRRPGLLLRSLFAMNVVMPLFAAALAAALSLHPAVKVALIALAVSPVPPLSPKRQLKAGGQASYTIGLLVAAALVAVVLVPTSVSVLGRVFGRETDVPIATVASIVATSVLAPLAIGLAIRHFAPRSAERLMTPAATVGGILLFVGAVPIVIAAWPSMLALVGNGTVLALAAFSVVALAVGHALGGPDPDERTVLALSTASRHPALAIAIGTAAFSDSKAVMAAVLLYVVVSALVSIPYINRTRTDRGAGIGGPAQTPLRTTPPPATIKRAWG